ncbi:MAG: ATP-binding protein [Bacteroidia bacterium]|nr:ATP-binding protein [Bacteroidia bacterium]
MDLTELKRKAAAGEGEMLEFKQKARHPDKIARELVAFANTAGGLLLVGVDDDGVIHGTKTPEEDIFAITQFLDRYCVPRLPVRIERIPVGTHREVIALYVRAGRRKPHFVKPVTETDKKTAYVRVQDMSVTASREMVELLRYAHRRDGVTVTFGSSEQKIMGLLERQSRVTFEEVQAALALSRRKTSELLVLLIRAGLLRIQPSEKGDFFSLNMQNFS